MENDSLASISNQLNTQSTSTALTHPEQQDGSRVGQEIAQLLQTVKSANAFVDPNQPQPQVQAQIQPETLACELNLPEPLTCEFNQPQSTADEPEDADNESNLDSSTSGSDYSSSDEEMEEDSKSTNKLMADLEMDYDDEDDMMTGGANLPLTRHEVLNPQIAAPPITQLPQDIDLRALGTVHSLVDNSIIIQAHVSGEQHVLDSDSLVILSDRSVLGLVFDVFGPVTRPMYTVRFNSANEAQERGKVGEQVYFASNWSKLLATERLRVKGTDASNEFDEEVASDDMEFSDDEAERLAKSRKKKSMAAKRKTPAQNAAKVDPSVRALPQSISRPVTDTRQLQSYGDLYDPELGF
ncbi:Gar1/Naf1 RNA binding region-domain-containing protein [Kickxella alabastrina]|uniref:Gar1/Naf1 RNA binding region-domain-containing protein n=1 Tax=Kickxella alabastrina TaxID=61397 RepID=UPI00221ED1C4|nr:Gar1/Naf1 RNA binding region-domain-containing protein [Kickxella alabastrina]KAI7834523.1 Gar1/Naf1 RNA binding region-domain-containing protein [Kickxella alabastrina]